MISSGIYNDYDEKAYHADPCPEPSLSSTLAKVIYSQSPRHAWTRHPRLNPNYTSIDSDKFALGRIAHELLLEGSAKKMAVINADDWRTKAAQVAREEAKAAGRTPILAKQADAIQDMVIVARAFLATSELSEFATPAKIQTEQTLISQDMVWLRARLDAVTNDRRIILDYKTTQGSAAPDAFARTVYNFGYDIQAAFYVMLNQKLTGVEAKYAWLVQECEAPYACSLVGASPSVIDIATTKVKIAIELFERGLKGDYWPGYSHAISWIDCPSWEMAHTIERAENFNYQEA